MKGCFYLQRNFAYIGHNLVRLLQEKHGITTWCAYVDLRKSYDFLNTQKDVAYTALLLHQDVHKTFRDEPIDLSYLEWLESEYGLPFLWPYLAIDRVLMFHQLVREYPYDTPPFSYPDMLRILQVHAKAILTFLEKEKPNFIVFSVIAGLGSMLLYHIAQKQGIKTVVLHPTCMKYRYVLSDQYDLFTTVATSCEKRKINHPDDQHATDARVFLNSFRSEPHPYYVDASPLAQPVDRRRQFRFLLPRNLFATTQLFFSYVRNHFSGHDRYDFDYISPWNYFKDASKRKIRNLIGVGNLYDTTDLDEPFVFFPLQYEPELTTMLYAPYQMNQPNLIRQIARSLPVGYYLYVKEHPGMVVYRPRHFYAELKKIPNVKLVSPSITSFQLIARAKLITTITSTSGWEASLLKKPVITFGNVFYNQLSFVKKCRVMDELPRLVKDQLTSFSYDEQELLDFIAAIREQSCEVNLQYLWEREQDMEKKKTGLTPLADLIARYLMNI